MKDKLLKITETAGSVLCGYLFQDITKYSDSKKENSIKVAFDIYEEAFKKINSVVNCGDLVVVKIDKEKPKRFLLYRFNNYIDTVHVIDGSTEHFFEVLDVHTELGLSLLDKKLQQEYVFKYNDNSKQQTVKILSIRKTEFSEVLNSYELEADKKYMK